MVPLKRPALAPEALVANAKAWTEHYVEQRKTAPAARPRAARYGHPQVRLELRRMSAHKCFYCEAAVAQGDNEEVDHYVECAERPELAFEWSNLYLSCGSCNGKKAPNTQIPVAGCVDPCANDAQPDEHITFENNLIRPRNDSERGDQTIRKYALDRPDLSYARSLALNEFFKKVIEVKDAWGKRGGGPLLADEIERLRAFGGSTRPFSLMMRTQLAKLGL